MGKGNDMQIRKLMAINLLALSSFAFAQDVKPNNYIEFGGIYARYQEPSGWFTSGVAMARLGVNINEWIAIEGMAGTSLTDTNFYVGSTLVSARFDRVAAVHGKFSAPLSTSTSVFGRMGVASGQVSASTTYGSSWASGVDLSYGGGVQVDLNSTQYILIDYMSYYGKNGVTSNGLGATFGMRF
jgi:hypothetical protein